MYRNKSVKGFVSPLRQEVTEENKVFAIQEKTPSDLIKQPLRSNSQILNFFEKAIRENEVACDKVEVENPKKRDAGAYEKETSRDSSQLESTIFNVMCGKITTKKHKTWDSDGLLEVIGNTAILKDLDGNILGKTKVNPSNMMEGFRLIIGNKQIEIIDRVSQKLSTTKKHPAETLKKPLHKKMKLFTPPVLLTEKENVDALIHKKEISTIDSIKAETKVTFNIVYGKVTRKKHKRWDGDGLLEVTGKSAVFKSLNGDVMGRTTIKSDNLAEGLRLIIGNKEIEIIQQISQESLISEKQSEEIVQKLLQKKNEPTTSVTLPLLSSMKGPALNYEPLVMPYMNSSSLSISHAEQEVLVDSCLTIKLREHQRHGIVFLYECLMGLKEPDYFGAILADEMGLGKTLQCITLIWTMLRKGPYGKPIVKRVLIITPSSLCNNWKEELVKWLGSHRLFPYVVSGKNNPKDFTKYSKNSVMIISYEMFVKYHTDIGEIAFDLIVCDEGHRLKNSNVKAAKLLCEMNCKKRIILTGTPIQNDLKEFYALVDFINPGILGTSSEYKNYYEDPIVASQCPHATDDVISLGNERATELHERIKPFILRRTQETINKYLPHKYEIVLFCSLSNEQKDLYSLVTDAWFNKLCMEDKSNMHLSIITALKKICNHPSLFNKQNDNENTLYDILSKAACITQRKRERNFTEYCGKITILQTLMRNLKKTDEKLVLVSYYTQTLDLFEIICEMEGLKFLRLDGATSTSARSKVTDQFNTRADDRKILLLSAKAGGVGLNLPGASRLVLFDSNWNPASDVQAMARIWRDGQKRNVYIYRLLTTGTIEEKIYQRQISKASLSESVVDLNHLGSLKLSTAELKDLFTLTTDTASVTHDLMNCSCSGQNNESPEQLKRENNETRECQFILREKSQQNLTINQLRDWEHYKQPIPYDIMQDIMLTEVRDNITFIFKNSTTYTN